MKWPSAECLGQPKAFGMTEGESRRRRYVFLNWERRKGALIAPVVGGNAFTAVSKVSSNTLDCILEVTKLTLGSE